jgi:hypothetical protein
MQFARTLRSPETSALSGRPVVHPGRRPEAEVPVRLDVCAMPQGILIPWINA